MRIFMLTALLALPYIAAGKTVADILPLPSNIASGSKVQLQCGRIYSGTLDLAGKSNVTVTTAGNCGKASISPGRPVTGWKKWTKHIYAAPLDFKPSHVVLDDMPLELAHYPNRPEIWASGKALADDRLQARIPQNDLAGAMLVFRANDWMIEERRVSRYEDGIISVAPKDGDVFGFNRDTQFYLEGKLWMLDSPGEWAFADGFLYLWPPDGKQPAGTVWASSDRPGINADESSNILMENLSIFAAGHGIRALNSRNLQVRGVDIDNSLGDGIHAGGDGLLVDGVSIRNSGKNGIWAYYGSTRSAVRNSIITATGMVGMPKRSRGGIVFELGAGQHIENNKVIQSSYIGIRVHRDAVVTGNVIDGACLILTDCGGIYTFARDRKPSNVRIENNTIRNLAQRWAHAVYLDDYANGVLVRRNIIDGNPSGLQIHNGHDNEITENIFSASKYQHVLLNETGKTASISRNRFRGNVFLATTEIPVYRFWSVSGNRNLRRFAESDRNIYAAATADFAELAGIGMVTYTKWRKLLQQDANSSMKAMLPAPSEKQLRAMLELIGQEAPGESGDR